MNKVINKILAAALVIAACGFVAVAAAAYMYARDIAGAEAVAFAGLAMTAAPALVGLVQKICDVVAANRDALLDWMADLNLWASVQGWAAGIVANGILLGVTILLWAVGIIEVLGLMVVLGIAAAIFAAPLVIETVTDIILKTACRLEFDKGYGEEAR